MTDLRDVRREYTGEPLTRAAVDADPMVQFEQWMTVAREYHSEDSSAMVLSTATLDGMPSSRTVLLKHFDQHGFCWYSNSGSLKGQQLEANNQAALQFYWQRLNRQIRIQGIVERLSRKDAEVYFESRPTGSKISAFVSRQSRTVTDRKTLEAQADQLSARYPDGNVPCPEDWCGFRLKPQLIEFWQGRENRLHDRLQYELRSHRWQIERLAP